MYCRKCGKELKAGARFCPSCGAEVAQPSQGGQGAPGASRVPVATAAAAGAGFASAGVIALIVAGVVGAVVAGVILLGGGGSLSGTYTTSDGSFLVTKIEFSPDGTFRAWDSYDDWNEEPLEHGTYRGSGGSYTLEFDNLVMKWCTLEAEETGDGSLLIEVIPGTGGYVWTGATAYFYK